MTAYILVRQTEKYLRIKCSVTDMTNILFWFLQVALNQAKF